MKKLAFLFFLVSVLNFGCAQQNINKNSGEEASGNQSSEMTEEKYTEPGEMVQIKTSDGKMAKAFEIKSTEDSKRYLLVFHEWWGLNDHIKRVAKKLHSELKNVNVLAIDLYDGKLTDKKDLAEEYMDNLEDERAEAIIAGVLKHLPYDARIATIGWGLGGTWSLEAAMIAGANVVGCVIYYGEPEDDAQKLKQLNTDVLGIFAEDDGMVTPEIVEDFVGEMEEANEKVEIEMLDAGHGFAHPNNTDYDKEAAEKAYSISLKYLQERFDAAY